MTVDAYNFKQEPTPALTIHTSKYVLKHNQKVNLLSFVKSDEGKSKMVQMVRLIKLLLIYQCEGRVSTDASSLVHVSVHFSISNEYHY